MMSDEISEIRKSVNQALSRIDELIEKIKAERNKIESELKERILDAIPPDLRDKIATEKDVSNVEELKKFLIEKGHPIAKKIIEMEKKVKEVPKKVEKAKPAEAMPQPTQIPISPAPQMQPKVVTSGSSSSNIHGPWSWRYYCYSYHPHSYSHSTKRAKYYCIT